VALLGHDPQTWVVPQPQTRWTLRALRDGLPCFWAYSLSGVWRILARHRLRRRRARDHLRSPDPAYQEKLARLLAVRALVAAAPERTALVYLDQFTYYRQPSRGYAYAPTGATHPRAERSTRSNAATRIVGTLDAHTGRVVAHQRGRITVAALVRFYRALADAYPGRQIYLVLDNWPVHFHPDVLAALEPQDAPFPFVTPPTRPTSPSPRAARRTLPIQLVPLPTYASWLNPIEKLWRWLNQDVLHLHRHADDLPALRARVLAFLDRFKDGSPDLLRYVGLSLPT
jgi:hypothetical protein